MIHNFFEFGDIKSLTPLFTVSLDNIKFMHQLTQPKDDISI